MFVLFTVAGGALGVKNEPSFYTRLMPRVSEAHLAARRQQIMDAARRCFASNGFHATSMQEIIDASGLSVGAFYRYFKSKEELVSAIATEGVAAIEAGLARLAGEDLPLDTALDQALKVVERGLDPGGVFQMGMQVWAESFRNPELAGFVKGLYERLRGHFVELAARAKARGELPADADPAAVGAVLFGLIPAYGLQRLLTGGPDREAYAGGIRAMLGGTVRASRP